MRRIIVLIMIVLVILLAAGCSKKEDKVTIGYFPVSGDLAFFVSMEKGFLQEEGLKVEPVRFTSSRAAMDAMLIGKIDAVAPIGFTTIFGVEQNQPGSLKIYLPGGETKGHVVSHIVVGKDSDISSIEDLKGKKVGTYAGTAHRMWIELLLKKLNLDPQKDVTVVQVDSSLLVPSLFAGQFDALYATEPYTTIALVRGEARSLIENPRSKYIIDPFPSGSFAFTTSFWQENPEVAKKIYKAMKRSVKFIDSNPLEAKLLLLKYTPIDEEVARASDVHAVFEVNDTTIKAIQEVADMLFDYNILEKRIEVEKMVLTDSDFN